MIRSDGRRADQPRPISFELGFTKYAEGSVLANFGETQVLCNVSLDEDIPAWLRNRPEPQGWLTAEYALLPRSTHSRVQREQRWPRGRTQEISRLIGRSLRMAVDLHLLGERQLIVDCDVLQADGGTRTAAVSGGWVAVNLALQPLIANGAISSDVFLHQVAAISVGVVQGTPLLDLAYEEDVAAEVDLNVVMTGNGDYIEIQGTAEKSPFPGSSLIELLDLANEGVRQVIAAQDQALGKTP
jgi:ribonuclease PH